MNLAATASDIGIKLRCAVAGLMIRHMHLAARDAHLYMLPLDDLCLLHYTPDICGLVGMLTMQLPL